MSRISSTPSGVGSLPGSGSRCAPGLSLRAHTARLQYRLVTGLVVLALLVGLVPSVVPLAHAAATILTVIDFSPSRAGNIASNPVTNKVYVAREDEPAIKAIDGNTNAVVGSIGTAGYHTGLSVNSVTNRVYVSQQFASSVKVIDGVTDTGIADIAIPSVQTISFNAVDPGLNRLYVVRPNNGDIAVVEGFVREALEANGGRVQHAKHGGLIADLSETPVALRDAIGEAARDDTIEIVALGGALRLNRSHPVVQALAAFTVDTALDTHGPSAAARCGVLRTRDVENRTTLLLLRLRIHLTINQADRPPRELLAEDAVVAAFTGTAEDPNWLSDEETAALFQALPAANIGHDLAVSQLERARDGIGTVNAHLEQLAQTRADELLAAHRRIRDSAGALGSYDVRPQLPVDVLGLYVFMPFKDA